MSGYGWSDPCDPIPWMERMGMSGYQPETKNCRMCKKPIVGVATKDGVTEWKCNDCGVVQRKLKEVKSDG
jgi:hypothetical protein